VYTGVDKYVKEVPVSKMASILAGNVELPTVICSMVTMYAGLHFHPDDQKGWLQILSIQFTNLCQRREKPGATDHHVTNDAS